MMPKRHFQAPTSDAKFYWPEVEIALQNELRALADIEALYEEQRENLERSAVRSRDILLGSSSNVGHRRVIHA